MALWEYKVISSGKGGFATPALLESFLNQLGTEEWEIIEFRTPADNPLAFHGLARRPTQRDWTLEAAAAAAARVEGDKLRAEFAAKFQAATAPGSSAAGAEATQESGGPNRDDSFRRLRDTEHDLDPDALDDTAEEEAEIWPEEDQLPSFFEAIRPHMRRNQKGPGYSVGIEYLIKKFEMIESDLVTALEECGFAIPQDEDDKPVYIEYDGDLYWLNINRRGELWINAREKPRPVFRTVKGTPVAPEQAQPEKPEPQERKQQHHQNQRRQAPVAEPAPAAVAPEPAAVSSPQSGHSEVTAAPVTSAKPELQEPSVPLPTGPELLALLRPMMRRSRGGWSGTISYLSRALKRNDSDLVAALAAMGLTPPATSGEKAPTMELDGLSYWLNRDGRGGIWINGRDARRRSENRPGETSQDSSVPASSAVGNTSAALDSTATETPVVVAITPLDQGSQDSAPKPEVQAIAVAAALASLEPETDQKPVQSPAPAVSKKQTSSSVPAKQEPTLPLAGVRLLLKELKPGSFSMEVGALAAKLGKSEDEFLTILVDAGLKVPEKAREKPVFVEHAQEIFWLNRNAKGVLWLNAKQSKYAAEPAAKKPRRPSSRPRGKK